MTTFDDALFNKTNGRNHQPTPENLEASQLVQQMEKNMVENHGAVNSAVIAAERQTVENEVDVQQYSTS